MISLLLEKNYMTSAPARISLRHQPPIRDFTTILARLLPIISAIKCLLTPLTYSHTSVITDTLHGRRTLRLVGLMYIDIDLFAFVLTHQLMRFLAMQIYAFSCRLFWLLPAATTVRFKIFLLLLSRYRREYTMPPLSPSIGAHVVGVQKGIHRRVHTLYTCRHARRVDASAAATYATGTIIIAVHG